MRSWAWRSAYFSDRKTSKELLSNGDPFCNRVLHKNNRFFAKISALLWRIELVSDVKSSSSPTSPSLIVRRKFVLNIDLKLSQNYRHSALSNRQIRRDSVRNEIDD